MSDTIDFHKAATKIAKTRREEVRQALGGIELSPDEYRLICDLAWEGGSPQLISLIGKVREAERAKSAPTSDSEARFEFNPANEDSKATIMAAIHRERRRIILAGWPGLPVGWLPLRDTPSLHELVDEGRVELITITTSSKTVPGVRAEYGYARIRRGAERPRR